MNIRTNSGDQRRGANFVTQLIVADLARMRPTALIVNTSRAEISEPSPLVEALTRWPPSRAAVNVYEDESVPLNAQQLILALENAVCAPHIGDVERAGYGGMPLSIFDQILACAAGGPVNAVNPEAPKRGYSHCVTRHPRDSFPLEGGRLGWG